MRNLLMSAALSIAATPAFAGGMKIAKDHAPIGVMGDHMHPKGEVMLSYRYMRMGMNGSRVGTDPISPATTVTSVPNPFAGAPMQPPTLRVVPLNMTMEMHMLGAMYAPTDWITLMAMGMVVDKDMDHLTFQGGMGTNVLGTFNTESAGIGDVKLSGLVRLVDWEGGGVRHHTHLDLGVSLPTGSIIETDDVLTPMGMTPTLRLPYPMQIGSGTVDFEPGIGYTGKSESFSWGAQYRATLRLGTNDEGYTLGDAHFATAWAQWGPVPAFSVSARLAFDSRGAIDGADPQIMAPVQTADPDFHGGQRLDVGVGMNLAGQHGVVKGHRLAVEVLFPVYQDLNGPQMETDWTLMLGWQKAF